MNRLDSNTRTTVLSCLLEGCSIRAAVQMTGVSKKAVMRLLAEAGAVAAKFQDAMLRGLTCRKLQVDELWGFLYCKARNVTPEIANKHEGAGDIWLWAAIDADSKLIASWRLGSRSAYDANVFIADLASRLKNRVQVTSDGYKVYLEAVEGAFGCDVDYAMLVKVFGKDQREDERRYSPGVCLGCTSPDRFRRPGPGAYQHQLCRAAQLDGSHEHETLHPTLEWLFAQVR